VNMQAITPLLHTKASKKALLRKRSNDPEPVCCQEVNMATELLWMALGGSNDAVIPSTGP
jgi:hypothetical protein